MRRPLILIGLLTVSTLFGLSRLSAFNAGKIPIILGDVWVANATTSDVRVYDGATFELQTTIPVGSTPQSMTLHPTRGEVWVANSDSRTVSIIDTSTQQISREITSKSLVNGPTVIRFDREGVRAFLVGSGGEINVIDTGTYEVTLTRRIGLFTYGLVVMPDGTLRAANRQSGDVSVINQEGRLQTRHKSGTDSYSIVADDTGATLFVAARGWDAVSVMSGESHELLGAIPVGRAPELMALSPDGSRLWVTNSGDNTVSIIDVATFQVIGEGGRTIHDTVRIGDRVGTCFGCVRPVVPEWNHHPVRGVVERFFPEGVLLRDGERERLVPVNVFLGLTGGLLPHGVYITDDNRYAFVTFTASDEVFVYDAHSGERRGWLHGCDATPTELEAGCNPGAVDVIVVPH